MRKDALSHTIQFYLPFPEAILVLRVDYLRVTHPFATVLLLVPFDLHVLGMPPALILSQDRTLQKISFWLFAFLLKI